MYTVNLTKSFTLNNSLYNLLGLKKGSVTKILDNINLKIDKGKILVLAGESGSGKTTLAKLIMRSIEPDSGKIFFEGREITNIKGKELIKLRSKIQMVFQDPYSSLNPRMKIFNIIKEPLDVHNKNLTKIEKAQKVFAVLRKVNLEPSEEISNKYPHMLSGGQRQRVSFARALVLKPTIIIADEPVSMLDVSVRFQILELMHTLKEIDGLSFLYITHDLSTAKYVGDNIAILYKGQIIEYGNINTVISNPVHAYTKALISAIPKFNKS